jgi:hypothetical protein
MDNEMKGVWKEAVMVYVRFQVFTVASMNMTTLWDIVLCSLVKVDPRFGGVYCLHLQCPDDGGSMNLWNIGLLQQDYTVLHARKLLCLVIV